MKTFFQKFFLGTMIAILSIAFAIPIFAQSISGSITLPGGTFSFYIPIPTAPHVNLTLNAVSSSQSATTSGAYDQTLSITPSAPLVASGSVTLQTFVTYPPALAYQQSVTIPSGDTPTTAVVPTLAPGYYESALYYNGTQVSNRVYFQVGGTTGSIGGLYVVFPPGQQSITGTSATLTGVVSVGYTMPVNLSYVWAAAGSPFSNPTQLINLVSPGMIVGTTQNVTLNMAPLTPGSTYQFALKNNNANSLSSTLQFTTPTTGTQTSLTANNSGSYQQPSNVPAVTDTISGTGIVPQCGRTPGTDINGNPIPVAQTNMCTFQDFLTLVKNILKYALIILGPLVAIIAMYAGAMIIWLGKIPDPTGEQRQALTRYKNLLVRVAIGVVIILCAWIIIATIIHELNVKPNYSLLDTSHLN